MSITDKRVVIFLAFLVCMVALEAKTEKEKFELLGCHVELTMPDTTCTYIRRQYNYEEGVLYECIFDNNKGCLIILQGAMMSIMPVDQFIKDSRKTRGCNNGLYWRREIYRNNYGDIRLYYLNVKPEWKFFFDNVLDSVRVYSSGKKDKGIIYTSPSMNHTNAFDLKIFEGGATLHTNLSNLTLYVGKYLEYNSKEFDNLYRLNWLDYGARQYIPDLAQFTSVDPLAEKYYHLSPYTYCANNPVNAVDPDGKLVIFINGQHGGSGGTRDYWNGLDESMMNIFGDRNSMYVDGAMGGWRNTFSIWKPNNISASNRYAAGVILGYKQSEDIISRLKEGETIKVVSHSMGAAFSKGYITAVLEYAKNRGINYENLFQIEVDLAPFQPTKQHPVENVPTYVIQHKFDGVAGTDEMPNAHNFITRKDVHFDKYNALNTMLYEHSVDSFSQKEINEKLPKR